MNGSDVWGSSAPYGDVLPLQKNEYFPFKTVIIDNSLQNTLGEKKCRVSFGNFLILLPDVQLLFCHLNTGMTSP